ncbi:MAG: tetratricopeptide repeat protein [Limisphaerales bacterium]
MSRPRLIALLLALVTLVVFLPAVQFRFVNFDDNEYITENPAVKQGLTLSGVEWAFTTFHGANWHPLTWLSHMADCELFGLNAGGHHFVNILFHAVNTALLFILLLRLTQKLWACALVAALFAWHPLHVESVAWIAERKDVLSTCFALLALLSYTRYAQTTANNDANLPSVAPRRVGYLWFGVLFFALGLMAKPMLVTLPFLLLLLDFWPLQRLIPGSFRWSLLWEKTPFFLLAAASCVITLMAQRAGHAVVSLDQLSFPDRLANALVSTAGYVQNFFWPVNLCAIYLLPEKVAALQVVFAFGMLVLISVAAWHWRKTRPYCLMGWLWFLGTLIPVCGLVQVGNQAMADRYTYIPSIGFFLALVFLADELATRMQTPRIIRFGCAGLISVACIVLTEKQLQSWHDGESLFRRAVAVNPNNEVALLDLGVALAAQGRFDEALEMYQQAEKNGSRRFQVYNNSGNVLGLLGRHAESVVQYRKAIQLAPGIAVLHSALGSQFAALGQYDEALVEFSEAEKLDPNHAKTRMEAAKTLFKMGRDAEGLNEFHIALQIEPGNYQTLATVAHYLAANENTAARDGPNALALALKANELSGRVQPMVFDILGMAFAENGDFTNAITCSQNALAMANAAQMKNIAPIQMRLELYKNKQPWRESFRATNALGKP